MKRSWPILPGLLVGVLVAGAGCGTQRASSRHSVALAEMRPGTSVEDSRPPKSQLGAGDSVGRSNFLNYLKHARRQDSRETRHAAADSSPDE